MISSSKVHSVQNDMSEAANLALETTGDEMWLASGLQDIQDGLSTGTGTTSRTDIATMGHWCSTSLQPLNNAKSSRR